MIKKKKMKEKINKKRKREEEQPNEWRVSTIDWVSFGRGNKTRVL